MEGLGSGVIKYKEKGNRSSKQEDLDNSSLLSGYLVIGLEEEG